MKEFFTNINQELKKITWPTGKELKQHSIQVFVFMVILGLFFAGVDAVISTGVAAATGEDYDEYDYEDYDENDLDDLLEFEHEYDLDDLLDYEYDYDYYEYEEDGDEG